MALPQARQVGRLGRLLGMVEDEYGMIETEAEVVVAPGVERRTAAIDRGHQADADDALQRTYLKALEHWPDVSGLADQKRSAWLATTLAREVLQIWRAPHRARETGSHDDAGQLPGASAGPDGPDAVFAADLYYKACQGIARLEGRQRDVIALHCLAGYEISEVAEMFGISPSRK